jgi:hypothetical protein
MAWIMITKSYYPSTPSNGILIYGENLFLFIRQGSRNLSRAAWHTEFPSSVTASTDFIPVTVQTSIVIGDVLSQLEFTREDLDKLAQSRIPEVRAASARAIESRSLLLPNPAPISPVPPDSVPSPKH